MASGPDSRRLAFEFQAGPYTSEELAVTAFSGREELSRAFAFTVELAATGQVAIQPKELLGQKGALALHDQVNSASRFVHGMIGRVEALGERRGRLRYRVLLVPELWKLRHVRRSRIFQEKSVPEIVQQVLDEAGIAHGASLKGSYAAREFCVQYRESDFDFVCRLLESEGICFFFEHTEDSHTLMLGDGPDAHTPIPGEARLPFRGPLGTETSQEHVLGLERAARIRPGAVALRDFDFVRPSLDLTAKNQAAHADKALEIYDAPGKYVEPGVGRSTAKVRMEELRYDTERCDGECSSVRLSPGFTFTLTEHPDATFEGDYLVVSVEHSGGHEAYHSRFHAIPAGVPFRPPRLTPVPTIAGAQTAIVVGPSGEEIHTDEHGRVKVKFHWDREAPGDDKSSCWMRVSQAWAGASWGALYLPRVGHEVVVRFLEGDPDRPLVVGSVYNGENATPQPLPDEKTISTLRSSSSPGGDGYNELRFEDASGGELIHLHGQKDWKIEVLNDKKQSVSGFESLTVSGNRTQSVDQNQSLTVQLDDGRAIKGNQTLTVLGKRSVDVGGDQKERITGNQSITVGMASLVEVAMASAEIIGAAKALTVGGAYAVTVAGAINEAAAGVRNELIAGASKEFIAADREEHVKGKRSTKIWGSDKATIQENLSVTAEKDATEETKGDAGIVIKGATAWTAKEFELKADKLTLSVGGKVLLSVKQSGQIKWSGKTITLDGSDTKFKGRKVKLISPASIEAAKAKKAKDLEKDKDKPVPVIKEMKWDKDKVEPNRNTAWPPSKTIPAEAKVSPQVTTENVPDGTRAQIAIHHCVTGARIKDGLLKNLVVQGNKVVDKKTGKPPIFVFESKHLPWDPWASPFFFFSVKLAHKGLTDESPSDLSKDRAKTLRVEYWHMAVCDAVADTPGGGNLTTQAEMNEIAGLLGAKPHHKVGKRAFNTHTLTARQWGNYIRNTYAYHHASHGDVADRATGQSLNDPANNNPPHAQPGGIWHSVISMGAQNSPTGYKPGTKLGDTQVQNKTDVPSVPRYLVYLNICVAGWEASLGNAFIARGTRNFLAFRCYIPDGDARSMARRFYTRWGNSYRFNPAKIPAVFFNVGAPFYRSMRPVLMGKGGGAIAAPGAAAVRGAVRGMVDGVSSLLK
ncbi:MAG: type VI secretion system Vgr family protein [Hyalangium sp.]|uniref:type VI secretion system Vgr family protein n=1 Tax=Hyalangium sp. TaxID=2028555 RepID=UPI00389AA0D8